METCDPIIRAGSTLDNMAEFMLVQSALKGSLDDVSEKVLLRS